MTRALTNEFSWKTATFMARLSYYSYAGEKEFNKQFKKHWDNIEFFSKGGTECYDLHCPKNYIVVFRGTEPTSWEDIKADIQFHKQKKEYDMGITVPSMSFLKPTASMRLKKKDEIAKVRERWMKTKKKKK